MNQKPEIQYVGQFYIYGSEAKAEDLIFEKFKGMLPKPKLPKLQKLYIDPVALVGISVAVIMLVVLAVGALQLRTSWQDYNVISYHLSEVKRENAMLEHAYHLTFNPEVLEQKALGIGMVPSAEVETRAIRITVPAPRQEPTFWEDIVWFVKGFI